MQAQVEPQTASPPIPQYEVHIRESHPKQLEFVASRAKRKIVRAGRRGGKTVGSATIAVQRFLEGWRILYATPTQEQIGKFWREVKRALREPISAGIFTKNETEHFIELAGSDQRIRAKTAWNADTLRGDYADLLILDEWQLMAESAWGEVGAPMLLDNDGDAVFIYTPPSLHSRSSSKAKDPRHAAKMFKRAQADPTGRWETFTWTSHDNPAISEEALAEITKDMTRLAYRQEIMAEDVDEVPGAMWGRDDIDHVEAAPALVRIAVALDPSATSNETSDECGIMVGGVDAAGHGYLLKDASKVSSPRGWAATAVSLYHEFKADRIVAEVNNGGEMVELTVKTVDDTVSYRAVNASRGKLVRAEPVCALYEKKLIHHVGEFPELEDEMCSYVPGDKSPNRMDAMVWLFSFLMLESQVLGLIGYYTSGQAARDLEQLRNPPKPTPESLPVVAGGTQQMKPAVPDGCPECGSKLVGPIAGGQWRCKECAVQWWPNGVRPAVAHVSRREALEGM